ncbi:MAG: twin-arginine translocase TatA/TatE family subunit [Chloroflexi bacterium]|nr:twin-arginine translocase TatA/TatE family subunit [Chloroflexota bacterium]
MNLGPTELFIILVIVLLLFGANRIARLGGEMGSAIREFRRGLQGDDDQKTNQKQDDPQQPSA